MSKPKFNLKKPTDEKQLLKIKLKRLKKKLAKFLPSIPVERRDNKACISYYGQRDNLEGQIKNLKKKIASKPVFKPRPPTKLEKEKVLYRESFYSWLGNLPFRENEIFKDYSAYCRSEYFRRLKAEVLLRDRGKCRVCGQKAHTAHHEKYRWQWTRSRVEDCIAVCNPCHQNIHFPKNEAIDTCVKFDEKQQKFTVEFEGKFKGAFLKQADAEKRLQSLRNSVEK
jgi:hypothetical protein